MVGVRKKIKDVEGGVLRPLAKWELLERINKLSSLRDRALVCFLLLTGCRVEEVCRYIIEKRKRTLTDRKTKIKTESNITERIEKGKPIQKKQIEIKQEVILINTVRILKRRRSLVRTVPILRNDFEKEFVEILLQYINNIDDDTYLFPFTRQRAYQIMQKVNLFPHYSRHIRNTLLVTHYDFNASQLRQFNGWASSQSADSYIHLSSRDLVEKMKKTQ